MKYHFKIHKEKRGYWAQCVELPGCVTQANNKQQLQANMQEALHLYLDEPPDLHIEIPLPSGKVPQGTTAVSVDAKIAFALLLRKARDEQKLSQRAVASLLNYNSIFSYQKLESARSANPTLKTVQQLKAVLPNLRTDLLFA